MGIRKSISIEIEFAANFEYLLTRPGLMKLITLFFGFITLGVGIHGVNNSMYNQRTEEELKNEIYFESTISSVFVLSFFYLLLLCFSDDIATNKINRIVDTIIHALAGKALIVGGVMLLVSTASIQSSPVCRTIEYFKQGDRNLDKCQLDSFKYAGGILALVNAALYEVIAYFVYTTTDI
jgi:hypothetical protein